MTNKKLTFRNLLRDPDKPRANHKDRERTLEEIADIFGTSRERIRQIEQTAFAKIRRRLRAKGINPENILPD